MGAPLRVVRGLRLYSPLCRGEAEGTRERTVSGKAVLHLSPDAALCLRTLVISVCLLSFARIWMLYGMVNVFSRFRQRVYILYLVI